MIGDTDQIIEESQAGIAIKKFDDEHYLEAINKSGLPENFNSQRSRAFAQKYFSLEKGIESYEKVYEILLLTV